MNEQLIDYLTKNSGQASSQNIIITFVMAFVLGMIIYISYKYSYVRVSYSQRFNTSLVLLTLIITMVMYVIGSNVALSLGMVGALSIVRFRTAVKDTRDAAYLFWVVAVGICCGVSDYRIAGIGTIYIVILILILGHVQNNSRYLLVVHANRDCNKAVKGSILEFYSGKAIFKADNSNGKRNEIIYLISTSLMRQARKKEKSITDLLYEIDGVEKVNLVSQNNDMNG